MNELAAKWTRFWFEPISPIGLCLYRILVGLLAIGDGLLWLPDFLVWFGKHGVLPVDTMRTMSGPYISLLLLLNPDDSLTMAILFLYIIAAVCLTVGFKTRWAAALVWFLSASFSQRNPFYWHSITLALRFFDFLLIFSSAGAMFSIDSWLARKKGTILPALCAAWPQRLIQVTLSFIYFKAFWGKLTGETWRNGTALYYATHNFLWNHVPAAPLYDQVLVIKALTWGTLLTEFSLWSLVWFRPLRYRVLAAGLIFHTIITLTINLDFLEFAIIGTYLTFIDPSDLQKACRRIAAWATRGRQSLARITS